MANSGSKGQAKLPALPKNRCLSLKGKHVKVNVHACGVVRRKKVFLDFLNSDLQLTLFPYIPFPVFVLLHNTSIVQTNIKQVRTLQQGSPAPGTSTSRGLL